jgi:hypothetical protein
MLKVKNILRIYNNNNTNNKNYTLIKGRQAISCAANPFCIANHNLWKTTFIDLDDTTLLCMIFWTLFKILTASGAKKLKVLNVNGIKIYWLSVHAFSCLAILLEVALRVHKWLV